MKQYRPEIARIAAEKENIERVFKLRKFIKAIAEEYASFGVPIDENGRIDMESFGDLYGDVGKDRQAAAQRMKKWYEGAPPEEAERQKLFSDGERLEMLTYAILHKNLGSKFIVARSSEHDDHVHGVDQVLLERATGNVICAFDEVSDTAGAEYERKSAAVRDHNVKGGGATLKYGLKLEGAADKKIVPAEVKNIPIFYVALPKDRLEKGFREFLVSETEQSDFEKKLFEYFLAAMSLQVQGLELYSKRLDANLKNKLALFKKTLAELKDKKIGL